MINNLHVRNLALIDEALIDFSSGLNILTGETGAGKSIIIGSLGLALGGRADSDAIRSGCDFGLVELSISCNNPNVWTELEKMGIPRDSDEIIIKRRIYPGRSDCRINGESVSLRELSKISGQIIDICGQRESLNLLKETTLKQMLDDYGGAELNKLLLTLKDTYSQYTAVLTRLSEVDTDEYSRKRKADLAQFELDEINEANLQLGEDEELEQNYRRMTHGARITESMSRIISMCDGNNSSSELISHSLREIRSVSSYDEKLISIEAALSDLESMSSDLVHSINDYMANLEYSPEDYALTESRLNLINHLKNKYGSTIEQILSYRDNRVEEIDKLMDYESYIDTLNSSRDTLHKELINLSAQAHTIRQKCASKLEILLLEALEDMNFIDCKLQVAVTADEDHITANGYDRIDFMISMNPGEPLKSLSSVASGGELSRIMLAIKCITGERDNIGTMVFDEIDTGISGITAWKVGEKLSTLASSHQVICITHQAQIAAHADSHFLISKSVCEGRTKTEITPINSDGMITELARMMGSDEVGTAALKAAEELKIKAGKMQ